MRCLESVLQSTSLPHVSPKSFSRGAFVCHEIRTCTDLPRHPGFSHPELNRKLTHRRYQGETL